MGAGTILGALRGYAYSAAAVQGMAAEKKVAEILAVDFPPAMQTLMGDLLAALRADSATIVNVLARESSTSSTDDQAMLESLSNLVTNVYAESESMVSGSVLPSGKAAGPAGAAFEVPVGWALKWAGAEAEVLPIGPWLKNVFKWILGIGGGGLAAIVLYRIWQRTDPLTSIERGIEGFALIEQARQRDLANCAAGPDAAGCAERVNAQYNGIARRFDADAMGSGKGCGLLETPSGTLIGALVGLGLGWSQMRALMRW